MLVVDHQDLISKLGKYAKKSLEEAAELCISQGGYEITIEHFLQKALDYPASDLVFIFRHFSVDKDDVQAGISKTFEGQRVVNQSVPVFSNLLMELLQDSWNVGSLAFQSTEIRTGVVLYTALNNPQRYLRFQYLPLLKEISQSQLKSSFDEIVSMSGENNKTADTSKTTTGSQLTHEGDTPLERYGFNFTASAKKGAIDPIFCREKEIDQVFDILLRRRKNNPILVGEPGVGKSALIEGIALRIAQGEVPEFLQNVELWGLDLGALQAGASMKGEFEKRLKGVIEQAKSSAGSIILFIDEAHTLIDAGSGGGLDAANLLKPALARGELSTIAATTWSEYKKYFEKDPALSRRFQLVKLNEPSIEQCQIVLRGLLSVYEQQHGVLITEAAVKAAASLSARYISGRQLPDKAVDVLDTASARVAFSLSSPPRALTHAQQQLQQLHLEHKMLMRNLLVNESEEDEQNIVLLTEKISEVEGVVVATEDSWKHEKILVENYIEKRSAILNAKEDDSGELLGALSEAKDKLMKWYKQSDQFISFQVGEAEVAAVISDWTGVPVSNMTEDEVNKITDFSRNITQFIRGQDQAIKKIHNKLVTSMADLHREGLPLGVFLLVGPSGVGKTETALRLSELLFGSTKQMTIINMSEYQEKHTVSRLIGSPPGYVGYGEGGVLTEAIRQKPYSVVLLDEVEKADSDVLNLFYQAFDKGEMNDGEGRAIDCKNVIFILTSNLATNTIVSLFQEGQRDAQKFEEEILPALTDWFKPALLARMEVVPFLPLDSDTLSDIIKAKVDKVKERVFKKYKITVDVEESVYQHIEGQCNRDQSGVRIIDSILERDLLPPISFKILDSIAKENTLHSVEVGILEGNYDYTFNKNQG